MQPASKCVWRMLASAYREITVIINNIGYLSFGIDNNSRSQITRSTIIIRSISAAIVKYDKADVDGAPLARQLSLSHVMYYQRNVFPPINRSPLKLSFTRGKGARAPISSGISGASWKSLLSVRPNASRRPEDTACIRGASLGRRRSSPHS